MPEQMHHLGLILAGGQSRRMLGPEKSLMAIGGKTLVERARDRLAPQTGEVVLNANGDPERFAALGLPVIADTVGGFAGPLAGILAGMQWAAANRPQTTHMVSVAADTPFFPPDLVKQLVEAAPSSQAIVIARSAGHRHPVFGLWPVSLESRLQDFLDSGANPKIMAFVADCEHAFAEFEAGDEPHTDPFFNVNTPQEFAIAEAIARDQDHAA